MQAVEFGTAVHNGKIEVPQEYQSDFSSFVRVILIKEDSVPIKTGDASKRLDAFNRLDGLLRGKDLDIEKARAQRLSRQ